MATDGIVYLDSSALVKLVVREAESESLAQAMSGWLRVASSAIAEVEVVRRTRIHGAGTAVASRRIVESLELLPVTDRVLKTAAELDPPSLRSLDAIHIASALILEDELDALVTYDQRMAEAAMSLGIPVVSPA